MPARHQFGGLVDFDRVLAVVAHPSDESFGLGGLIWNLTKAGKAVDILSITGAASPEEDAELHQAARLLGAGAPRVAGHTRGSLDGEPRNVVAGLIQDTIAELGSAALLAFDTTGVTGSEDQRATTQAALAAGEDADVPVIGWTISSRVARSLNDEFDAHLKGRSEFEIDFVVPVKRKRQIKAISIHQSRADELPMVLRRLELTGPFEWTRWLRMPAGFGR